MRQLDKINQEEASLNLKLVGMIICMMIRNENLQMSEFQVSSLGLCSYPSSFHSPLPGAFPSQSHSFLPGAKTRMSVSHSVCQFVQIKTLKLSKTLNRFTECGFGIYLDTWICLPRGMSRGEGKPRSPSLLSKVYRFCEYCLIL